MVDRLPVHTPYDGSSKPFTAGLRPLDLADWIEGGADLADQLREKRRLYAAMADEVHVEEADTLLAQREVLDLLVAHLPVRYPDIYTASGDAMSVAGVGTVETGPTVASPLHAAALLVAEDLILMRASPDGWRLAAGSLCFPSHWSLREKFGRPLHEIHEPVPGFGPGTRMAEIINRMFDSLKVGQPMQRFNWSLQGGDGLYQPFTNTQRDERAATRPSKFAGDAIARAFIRLERQTLRKLPLSGDILFTIRIHLDPLGLLAAHPERWKLAHGFADQLLGLDLAQLDYKGLTADRDRLVERLRAIASDPVARPD